MQPKPVPCEKILRATFPEKRIITSVGILLLSFLNTDNSMQENNAKPLSGWLNSCYHPLNDLFVRFHTVLPPVK